MTFGYFVGTGNNKSRIIVIYRRRGRERERKGICGYKVVEMEMPSLDIYETGNYRDIQNICLVIIKR